VTESTRATTPQTLGVTYEDVILPAGRYDAEIRLTSPDSAEDLVIDVDVEIFEETERVGLIRGDANGDAKVDLADAIFMLSCLFRGGACTSCDDASEVNDDGVVDLRDPVFALGFAFLGASPPPAPWPNCGEDPTPDRLRACSYPGCP